MRTARVGTKIQCVLACVLTTLLVAGLVPVLPEAPYALADEQETLLELGDELLDDLEDTECKEELEGDEETILLEDSAQAVVDAEVEDGEQRDGLEFVDDEARGRSHSADDDITVLDGDAADEPDIDVEVQSSGVRVSNPRVKADSSMTAGQVTTWDCVWFGSYPQTEIKPVDAVYSSLASASWNTSGDATVGGTKYRRISKDDVTYSGYWSDDGYGSTTYRYFRYEPIKWRVLKVSGSSVLVVADVALDDQRYNTNYVDVTWETSSIRSWLNGYGSSSNQSGTDFSGKSFVSMAFTSGERSAIIQTNVANANNTCYGTTGGNTTKDKVFLLSESEVFNTSYGFASDPIAYDRARRCRVSDYAHAIGAYRSIDSGFEGVCIWWLRSPGRYASYGAYVYGDGPVNRNGIRVTIDDSAVRPALELNLTSSHLQAAGTVSSNGDANEQESTGDSGDEIIGGAFDSKTDGASFLHGPKTSMKDLTSVNKRVFQMTHGSGSVEDVWLRGDYGFSGVSNYANILPSDFRRFFGSVKGNPGRRGLARIISLMPWNGSCAGLTTSVATSYKGGSEILSRSGKDAFGKVGPPFLNKRVLSLVQCYQLANDLDSIPKAWYDATFPYTGSVDSVIKRLILDIREDGVSLLCFHGPETDHAILAISAIGDMDASDGTVRIGLYDVNSAGYHYKSTGRPFFTDSDCIEMEATKSGGKYTGFRFLDANNWVKYYKGESCVQFNQANTSLKVYDFKAEASTPLENVLTDLGFNLIMAASKGLRVTGSNGTFGISDGEVYDDGGGELLDGHWLSNSVLSGGQSTSAYVAQCSSDALVATPEDGGSMTLGLATADGSYSVDAQGADEARVSGKDGVKLEGKDVSFSLIAALDGNEDVAGIEVSATAKDDVSATLKGGKLVFNNEKKMEDVVISVTEGGETVERALGRSVRKMTVTPANDPGALPTVVADGAKLDIRWRLSSAKVTGVKARAYTGKARTQRPTVKVGGRTLKKGTDYKLSYKNNVKVGTATMHVKGIGNYKGTVKKTFKINKAANPMRAKAVKRTAKASKVKKKAQVVASPLKFTKKAKGKITYARMAKGSSKKLSVNKKTGKVTVKRGTKKGTYKVRIKVTAAGTSNYKKASKTLTCTVVVK